jgi:hypothetical protein
MRNRAVCELLGRRIEWARVNVGHWECVVGGKPGALVLNDSPDEPLYTVTFEGESLDLNDPPSCWTIE